MSDRENEDSGVDPGFFEDRFLIEILDWDWNLHFGLSSDHVPIEYRYRGEFLYARGLEIVGRIVAPNTHDGQMIYVWVTPVGPELMFGSAKLQRVGRFHQRNAPNESEFDASVILPEDSLAMMLTCLASVWKYIHIGTINNSDGDVLITDVSFSREIHENLLPWIHQTQPGKL